MNIDIYVIKSEHLKKRNMILSNTLNTIVEIMKKIGYTVNITNIFNPTVLDIETNIVEYNKSINYKCISNYILNIICNI